MATSVSNINKFTITTAGNTWVAIVDGSTTFIIESQQIGSYSYTGSGSLNGTTFNLTLNEYDASVPETCVYELSGTLQ